MTRDRIVEILRSLGACSKPGEAIPWAESLPVETTAAEAWASCQRGDWLVWLMGRLHLRGLLSRQALVLAACAAARTALGNVVLGEDRPRIAIETAEAWARGEASIEDVQEAADATAHAYDYAYDYAYDVAHDAYAAAAYAAAYAAAAYAADAAAYAADAAAADADAAAAADAYAYDACAYACDACDACDAAARAKRLAEIADAVRAAVPWSTVEAAVARLSERSSS